MQTIQEKVASQIYKYNGKAQVREASFLLPGDYFYEADGDRPLTTKLVSSRGFVVDSDRGTTQSMLGSGSLEHIDAKDLDAVRGEMHRQGLYGDADAYAQADTGDRALALYDTKNGIVYLERDGGHFSLLQREPEGLDDMKPGSFDGRGGFNPERTQVKTLETEAMRSARLEREAKESTPMGKAAAFVNAMAMKLAKAGIPDPEPTLEEQLDMTAGGLVARALQPELKGVERGRVVGWNVGNERPYRDRSLCMGIVTGYDGDRISILEIVDASKTKNTLPMMEIPAGGPFLPNSDYKMLDGHVHEVTNSAYKSGNGGVMFGGAKVPEDVLLKLEGKGGPEKPSQMERLEQKLERQDSERQDDAGVSGPSK